MSKKLTINQIKKIEEVLNLDTLAGLYLISSEYLKSIKKSEIKYLQSVNATFSLNNKIICAYNKEGLERYINNKNDYALFNPISSKLHLSVLFNALHLFNENYEVRTIKEDNLFYGQIIDNSTNEEVLITRFGYRSYLKSMMIVILMNWGYEEEKWKQEIAE